MDEVKNLLICVCMVLLAIRVSTGQENDSFDPAEDSGYSSEDRCIQSFRDGKVFTNSAYDKLSESEKQVLRDYFSCSAAATNDVTRCGGLGFGDFSTCSKSFNCWQGFYIKALSAQEVTPDIIRSCLECGTFSGPEMCQQLAEAIVKKDPEKCTQIYKNDKKEIRNCQGVVNLDATQSPDFATKDVIMSMRAIKNYNLKDCDKIKESTLRLRCKAFISASGEICETQEFKKVRDKYFCIHDGRE